jgi:hypothetical protein
MVFSKRQTPSFQRREDAIRVFSRNVEDYPTSWNVYDRIDMLKKLKEQK